MTNLLEKVLLTGFGIFIVTLFFSLINPFIIQIFEISDYNDNEIIPYLRFIDDVNYGINYVQKNDEYQFVKPIYYPNNMNITFFDFFAKFEFFIYSDPEYRIYEYDFQFFNLSYKQLQPREYILNISLEEELIYVNIY